MLLGSKKLLLLAASSCLLSGCAAIVEPMLGDSEKHQMIRTYIQTGFHTGYSYAYNVSELMFEDHAVFINYETDRSKFMTWLYDPGYGMERKLVNEPTKSWNFAKTVAASSQNLTQDLYSQSTLYGASSVSAVLGVASLFSSDSGSYRWSRDPHYDFMSDQVMIYVPRSQVEKSLDAEAQVYDAVKSALEKAAPSVSKEAITVTVTRGCEHTKITGAMKDDPKNVWMELYLHRLKKGEDDQVSGCGWSLTGFLTTGVTADIPMWLNKGNKESAWVFSRKEDSHLFVKGEGRKYLTAAMQYLPDNYFVYFAPRKVEVNRDISTLSEFINARKDIDPILYDNKGEHQFKKPTKSEMPMW